MKNSKLRELLTNVEKEFEERLKAKTNWGRNEVKQELQIAINKALITLIENEES
jgi:hypothetical protein